MTIQAAIKPTKERNKKMQGSPRQESIRKALMAEVGSYNDRNDGFDRTHFSRNKSRSSEIKKENKIRRIKPEWKQ